MFVDTSGFYALLDASDPAHVTVRGGFERALDESEPMLTTNYVVHESWALIQSRLGWSAVDDWRDRVLPLCETVWIDRELHLLGEARCRRIQVGEARGVGRRLSLTDCVSIEVMRQRRIQRFIGQDDHLAREGFRPV